MRQVKYLALLYITTESLDERELLLLVYRYCRSVPDSIVTMIYHYIQRAYWLIAGKAIKINDDRDTICTHNNGWSTAYSSCKAILLQQHKYIWQIEIIECEIFDDIRIGIASTMKQIDDEFAFCQQGHNYSYITYGEQSCVGYNGEFERIEHVHYGPKDIITIELDLHKKSISYFKNSTFVHKQNDIYCTDYRLAAAMYGNVSIKKYLIQKNICKGLRINEMLSFVILTPSIN